MLGGSRVLELEAFREDNLEDVACSDILFGFCHGFLKVLFGGGDCRFGVGEGSLVSFSLISSSISFNRFSPR